MPKAECVYIRLLIEVEYMLITAIEPRRKSLSAVYIDGEFAMKLDTFTLMKEGIKAGVEIDDQQLKDIIDKSDAYRAKEKALYLIGYRDHSKKELSDKIRRTCSKEAAEQAADKMEELGLVNDENYAKRYAAQLLRSKHMAPRGIAYKLREKGIDRDLIDEIIDEMEFDTIGEIKVILEKKYPRYQEDEKINRRAAAYLQRMGYGYGDIKTAMNSNEEYY